MLALCGIDASAGTDVISNHQPINQLVVTASSIGLAGLIFNQIWPQPLEVVVGRMRHRLPFRREDPFIPLSQAARELYEANLNDDLGRWARGHTDGGEAEILNWLAYWIAARFVVVYGKRTASTVMEPMPVELHTVGGLEGGATRFERDGFETWTDLSVRRDAFRAMIPVLSVANLPSQI